MNRAPLLASIMLLVGFGSVLTAQETSNGKDKASSDASKNESENEASPKPVTISGVFEAIRSREIAPDTEHFTSLEIERIVDHGKRVSKGDNLLWFNTEEMDEKIQDAEVELQLARLALEDARFKHQQFLETQKLDRESAKRARDKSQQDYDNFVKVDRQRRQETAEFNIKASTASLENAQEELEQLTQMYEEDDLTEESEEIVLKRARQAVESAQFRLDGVRIDSERMLQQTIPQTLKQQEESLARAELTYRQTLRDLDSARRKRQIELQRQEDDFEQQQEKLQEMKDERKSVQVITAPIDGIVLHGPLKRGKLGDQPSKLKPGTKVSDQQVVLTLVDPSKLQIRVDLDQDHLELVTKGRSCTVRTNAVDDFEAEGQVHDVSSVPYAGTKFDCVVRMKGKPAETIAPTMACELIFEPEAKKNDDVSNDQS